MTRRPATGVPGAAGSREAVLSRCGGTGCGPPREEPAPAGRDGSVKLVYRARRRARPREARAYMKTEGAQRLPFDGSAISRMGTGVTV
ncbi:MAG: hypothetical protein C4574_03275 [Candidatus Latescibacterota bacterium]|nr:MAG: hypothetical protein C4574_03275 [Candidatus Latescibacterota bacterium]